MIVQWCVKGLHLESDEKAKGLIDNHGGLLCNWWRKVGRIRPSQVRDKLTATALDRHINHFDELDPVTRVPFSEDSPFISLTSGTVERDAFAATNHVRRARDTALWFGTEYGKHEFAYLYTCWVLLAPRPAVEVEGVAEEVRDLNAYRRYSAYQTEGEVTAKIMVPDNQIKSCEKWELNRSKKAFHRTLVHPNPRFTEPEALSNVRELI
ncbi:hypothetical protein L3Q65_40530 [Amycolatopsis sp. FU40]|uniref:hypothetical protein n=1 Tax=Amycolatopsis sp. FU40 TaxID=2914159 RepID=UPI001F26887A|nr:hypothetical protein [Amycolatopsis sp. FU40]UKD54104.1 hypothetical protein L3Q65_40530 [Amycolatopsis sp. FU40]